MSAVDVRVVTCLAEMYGLQDEWEALAAEQGSPLLDHDWFVSAAEALHEECDLRVVTVRDQGRLVAVAPMAMNRLQRHLVILGTEALYEPSGWLFASESALGHLARAVAALGEVAVLDRVPALSPLCRVLPQMLRAQAVTIVRPVAPSFAVRTDRSWSVFSATLSTRTQHRIEKARSRAKTVAGDARIEELRPDAAGVDAAFSRFVQLESSGWKGNAGSSLAARPALLRFYQGYARRAASRGRLCITELWVGGRIAAIEMAVESHGRRWGLKLAYDERFAVWSPALQVVHASIKACTDRGLTAYEFLGSAEPWQKRWKPTERRYFLAAVYPMSGRAVITALYDAVGLLSRRLGPQARALGMTG